MKGSEEEVGASKDVELSPLVELAVPVLRSERCLRLGREGLIVPTRRRSKVEKLE